MPWCACSPRCASTWRRTTCPICVSSRCRHKEHGVRIGVPKEIKTHEYRVGLTPAGARELVSHGHEVLVERGAALGIGIMDAAYEAAGARLAGDADAVFAGTELVVKVKEPQPEEIARLRPGQVLFTYFHL